MAGDGVNDVQPSGVVGAGEAAAAVHARAGRDGDFIQRARDVLVACRKPRLNRSLMVAAPQLARLGAVRA